MAEKKGYIPRFGEFTYGFYLNGEPVDELPQDALDKMSERLSKIVSRYFSQHPDVYERFLAEQERKKTEDNHNHEGSLRSS